ncbi:hypothetical protein BC826DRAFT_712813 [Russula brevipes]|nr:hypothetical protein BC826DRAFT_712813 [Russula brevipes]
MAPVVRRQSALRVGQEDEWMDTVVGRRRCDGRNGGMVRGAEAGGVILFFVVLASPREWALRATQAPPPNGNENENERPGPQCRTPIQHLLPPHLASYKSLLHSPPSPFFDTPVCLPAHLHYTFNFVPHRPHHPTMLAPPQGPVEHSPTDPLVLYSRSLRCVRAHTRNTTVLPKPLRQSPVASNRSTARALQAPRMKPPHPPARVYLHNQMRGVSSLLLS